MTDFERVNQPRVAKIIDFIDMIQKSARSNSADAGPLLAPVLQRLAGTGQAGQSDTRPRLAMPAPADPVFVTVGSARRGQSNAPWYDVRVMAEQAPLSDLTAAMAIYLDRIDEALRDLPS